MSKSSSVIASSSADVSSSKLMPLHRPNDNSAFARDRQCVVVEALKQMKDASGTNSKDVQAVPSLIATRSRSNLPGPSPCAQVTVL